MGVNLGNPSAEARGEQGFRVAIRSNDERRRMTRIDVHHAPLGDVDDPVKRGNEIAWRQRPRQEIAHPAKGAPETEFHAHQRVEHGAMRDRQQRSGKPLPLASEIEIPT